MAVTTRPPATFRAEDLALAGWNLVAVPVAAALGGSWSLGGDAPLIGLLEVAAIVGAIVALATRTPDAPPLSSDSFRAWVLAGPLIGAVVLLGDSASDRLGLAVGGILGPAALVAVVAAFALADRLPVLDERRRRLLVTPFVFVAAGFFTEFAAGILDGLDIGEVADTILGSSSAPGMATVAAFIAGGLLLGSAAFYVMLVVAPRELAAPERRPWVWAIRFAVFLVSALVGAGGSLLL